MQQVMNARPDEVYRSGIIQPFSVRSMDPVQFARREIDPFINAIRPAGPQLSGAGLGIAHVAQVPTLGIARMHQVPTLGAWNDPKWIALYAGGALVLGLTAGLFVGKSRKRRRRR